MVEIICATSNKKAFFSSSTDGLIVKWSINWKKRPYAKPDWYSADVKGPAVSIDACNEMNLLASSSVDGPITLREISTGALVRLIQPNLKVSTNEYIINQIRLSYRGYILILAKQKTYVPESMDIFFVYSINGELIKILNANDCINTLLFDESGYQFIAGGKSMNINCYDLLSLSFNLLRLDLEDIQNRSPNSKHAFLIDSPVSAFGMIKKGQQLLIGLSNGNLGFIKASPLQV